MAKRVIKVSVKKLARIHCGYDCATATSTSFRLRLSSLEIFFLRFCLSIQIFSVIETEMLKIHALVTLIFLMHVEEFELEMGKKIPGKPIQTEQSNV